MILEIQIVTSRIGRGWKPEDRYNITSKPSEHYVFTNATKELGNQNIEQHSMLQVYQHIRGFRRCMHTIEQWKGTKKV